MGGGIGAATGLTVGALDAAALDAVEAPPEGTWAAWTEFDSYGDDISFSFYIRIKYKFGLIDLYFEFNCWVYVIIQLDIFIYLIYLID